MTKLKIDTPVMFTTHRVMYRHYTGDQFQDYTTYGSAEYMQGLMGGEISQVTLIKNKVVQEIPYEAIT